MAEELSRYRKEPLNFKPVMQETVVVKPHPFGDDPSFGAEAPNLGTNKTQQPEDPRPAGELSRAEERIKIIIEPQPAEAGTSREQLAGPKRKPEDFAGSDGRYLPKHLRKNLPETPDAQQLPQQKAVEQNRLTLAYRLFNVDPPEEARDALDEYMQAERARERDFFEMNSQYISQMGLQDAFDRRAKGLSSLGRLGLAPNALRPAASDRLSSLQQLLLERGVIECGDVISKLAFKPVAAIVSDSTLEKLRAEKRQQAAGKPEQFGDSLAAARRRLRDHSAAEGQPLLQ